MDTGADASEPTDPTSPDSSSHEILDDAGADAEVTLSPGDTIGGYVLRKRIGRGGMGEVWMAQHERHGRRAAVKIVLKRTYDESDHDELAREFKLLVNMRHDHIISVIDAGLYDDGRGHRAPYVVMDYVSGAAAITTYATEHHLDTRARLSLFRDVCAAVAYVHEHGNLHLDIKPENLLVDKEGRAFLTDFGLARPVLGWFIERVAGTPAFMSPEHLDRDVDRIDKRSDVWSLGAVLYWLIAEASPFDLLSGASPAQRREAVSAPPRSLEIAAPELRDEAPELYTTLETITQRCLDPDPDRRYENAGELCQAIDDALEVRGVVKSYFSLQSNRPKLWATLILTTIVFVATVIGTLLATPIMTLWPAPLSWYGSLLPTPRLSLAALNSLPNVAVVGFDSSTAETLRGAADLEAFEPLAGSRESYRPMHTALIPRLGEAGAGVIVFDIYFPFESTAPEVDEKLAAAIRSAQAAGTPVVLGVGTWEWKDGRPNMSPTIWSAEPLWGGLTVGFNEDSKLYWLDLLIEREGIEPLPSLAATAFAAFVSPATYHTFEVVDDRILVRHFVGDRPDRRETVREDWIEPSNSKDRKPADSAGQGFQSGDVIWYYNLQLPSLEALQASTLGYTDFWTAASDTLRARVNGKVVLIRDLERDNTVNNVMGAVVHIAAIQSLIEHHPSRLATWWNVPMTALGALVAAFAVWSVRRRMSPMHRHQDVFWRITLATFALTLGTLLGVALVLAMCWSVHWLNGTLLYPVPGAIAAMVVAALAYWAARPPRTAGAHGQRAWRTH